MYSNSGYRVGTGILNGRLEEALRDRAARPKLIRSYQDGEQTVRVYSTPTGETTERGRWIRDATGKVLWQRETEE